MAPGRQPMVLDGRTLEGGGQLLRIALGLSALTGIPVMIHSIRGNRSGGGGLKAQHLACVEWLAYACRAKVEGVEKGSKELLFVPQLAAGELSPVFKKVRIGQAEGRKEVYQARLDIKTAGSTGLALQAILPFILFTRFPSNLPVCLTLSGGTNVSQSPSYEYITQVLLPTLHDIGFPGVQTKLGKRGWSHGGSSIGHFTLEIPHRETTVLPAFHLTPPVSDGVAEQKTRINRLHATFNAPECSHEHFLTSLKRSLKYHFPTQAGYPSFTEAHENFSIKLEDSKHPKRMYFILVAALAHPASQEQKEFRLSRDWLYDRKLPQKSSNSSHDSAAEMMADRVCTDLASEVESGAWVDEHMRDQLVVFQALASGRSQLYGGGQREASLHARTAEWVAGQLLGDKGLEFDGHGMCQGFGFGEHISVGELEQIVEALDIR